MHRLTMMELRKTIIVTSDEPWSEVWHTQLHYAFQLSLKHKVFFVQPPTKWKLSNLFRFSIKPEVKSGSVMLVNYVNYLPATLGLFSVFVNDKLNQFRIHSLLTSEDRKNLIIWHFDPMRSHYLFNAEAGVQHVYHVVDPYAGKMLDARLAAAADAVVVTSPKFLEHYRNLNRRVMLVKQGVDTGFYQDGLVRYRESRSTDNRILLIGTLSNEVDLALIEKLAEREGFRFLFIGPDKITDETARQKFEKGLKSGTFTWLGKMTPETFLPYLVAGRIGIIAYDHHNRPVNNLRSPLKVITYLAAGKPVITNIDCEIPELIGKGIYYAGNHEEFIRLVKLAANDELAFDECEVSNYLNSVSYKKLIGEIFDFLHTKGQSHAG